MQASTRSRGPAVHASRYPRAPREARLRAECRGLYPELTAGQWEAAAVLADRLLAESLLRGSHSALRGRVLRDDHFDFRGGAARGGEREGMRPRREGI
jgi:hypothetical protein